MLVATGVTTGAIVVVFSRIAGRALSLPSPWRECMFWAGIILLIVGIYFWVSSVIIFKKALNSRRLAQTGVYSLSRNPMYAGFILFAIPGLALILNNMLLLAASVAMFAVFKLRIGAEENSLAKEFGAEYEQYQARVPQLIPFSRLRKNKGG